MIRLQQKNLLRLLVVIPLNSTVNVYSLSDIGLAENPCRFDFQHVAG